MDSMIGEFKKKMTFLALPVSLSSYNMGYS